MKKVNRSTSGRESWNRDATNSAITALARILAVLVLMALLGMGGGALDRWLGTKFLMAVGFGLGILVAILGMIYVVKMSEWERRLPREKEIDRSDEQRDGGGGRGGGGDAHGG